MEAVLEKPKRKKKERKNVDEKNRTDEAQRQIDGEPPKNVTQLSTNKEQKDNEEAPEPITELPENADLNKTEVKSNESEKLELASAVLPETTTDEEKSPESQVGLNKTKNIEQSTPNTSISMNSTHRDILSEVLKANKEILSDIENTATQKTEIRLIKPYSEAQLLALYRNPEREQLDQFISQFVEAELKGLGIKRHPLYELLSNYLSVKEKTNCNSIELLQVRREYKQLEANVWTVMSVTASAVGRCNDDVVVTGTYTYNKSVFHRAAFQNIVRLLANIQKLLYENHVLYSYSVEDIKLQIEMYIQNVVSSCLTVTQLNQNAPVVLLMQEEPLHLKPYLNEIRICISVLFAFQRKLIRDSTFLKETREWLKRLIAVLLRLANFQDHLFILNHVIRCPAGIETWASQFIQVPLHVNLQESPFANFQINHALTVLTAILLPVQFREKFLEDRVQNKDNVAEDALWVVIDSDGEEDDETVGSSLKENDLVSLLNQVPIDNLFRNLLLINQQDHNDIYNQYPKNEYHLLKYLSISTSLLHITHKGLNTYYQPKYRQFSKRLCRFVRHITQYATDQWEYFKKHEEIEDEAMLQRLQVEYDAFFQRAIYCLYVSQKLGAWQFLAVVPYHIVSIETIWKIFYFLHNSDESSKNILNPLDCEDYSKKMWESELRTQFDEKLNNILDDEVYYLLNTFANMALARDIIDSDFIYNATMDLLEIGFVNVSTQETCSKVARSLLTHLTSKYPHLLSNIFQKVKDNMTTIGSLALYLYEELPIAIWELTEDDLNSIAKLLLHFNIATDESKLARMILARLNWDGIPHERHCEVALLVLSAVDLEPKYAHWGWQTILRLKLHINDRGFSDFKNVEDVDKYDCVSKGIRQKEPLASFVAVLMTSWGHLVPLICTEGLTQLLFLQSLEKHEAVLFALNLIVPLFVSCQECIINCEKFQQILYNLINANQSYISIIKSYLVELKSVQEQFGNMIQTQIVNFATYNMDSPRSLVRLWINSLVSIPNWSKDMGVLYLLDIIIKTCFFNSDALDVAFNILRELQQSMTPQEQGSSITSFFKWVTNNNTDNTSLIISNCLSAFPYLAYFMIAIEHEERELKTGFWKELLIQLNRQKGKVNVDQAIKKTASNLKIPCFSSSSLCIYRWAQQAIDTPIDHPLLPLLWQKFFILFLERVTDLSFVVCVGEKFFDGLVNFAFLKRVKKRLQDTVEFYEKIVDEKDIEPHLKENRILCLKIFKAYALWLEESRIQENKIYLANLPPQYEPDQLSCILQGSTTPWFKYLNYDQLRKEQEVSIKIWRVSNFREMKNVNQPLRTPGSTVESCDPVERILRRIKSYDTPESPPVIVRSAPLIPQLNFGTKEQMFKCLTPSMKTLKQFAQNHSNKISQHKALDCTYQELIPQLYRLVSHTTMKIVPCKGANQAVNCSGPASVLIEVQEAKINERIEQQILKNRESYESLINESLQSPAISLCTASVTLQQAVQLLQKQLPCNPESAQLGVELFYYILSLLYEENMQYLPTKMLFASCLEKLGQSHICGFESEMPRLLQRILKEPNLGCYLAPHFSPSNVSTVNFLYMYGIITKEISQKYDIAFALLSKFEVEVWLNCREPKISQRSQFIESVIKALTTLGFDLQVEAMMLHGLYRKHLLTLFEFQFPEHFSEIILQLLKFSNGTPDSSLIAICVWEDVINSLSKPINLNVKIPLREQLRNYAESQRVLEHQQLLEAAELFAKHFTHQRLQYGLYGLYPKCRNYMDVFVMFLGMISHGLVFTSLRVHQDLPNEKVCEKLWCSLRDMFTPWLVPYSMQNLKDNMAAWIQQLADDRSVLLPWIPPDLELAQRVTDVLIESVKFLIHLQSGCVVILNSIWQWYGSCYTHNSVKDHIFTPIHDSLMKLPWQNFWPTVPDLELMLRIVDQYLPECHAFLGQIFMLIPWIKWLTFIDQSPVQTRTRVYQCYLNLLIKLLNEPKIRNKQTEKAKALLVASEELNWDIIDSTVYQHVMDWYVLSCDSVVIFKSDPLDLDFRILHFLRIVSGYTKAETEPNSEMVNKRLIFIRSYVRLVSVYTSKYKAKVATKEQELFPVISRLLSDLDSYVVSEGEYIILLQDILHVLNISAIRFISAKVFSQWIEKQYGDQIQLRAVLGSLGKIVADEEILTELMEDAIMNYFKNSANPAFDPSWEELRDLVVILETKRKKVEEMLIFKGNVLTLYVIILQKLRTGTYVDRILNSVNEWIASIKITENTESKLPLLWCVILKYCLTLCDTNEPNAALILHNFAQNLVILSDTKGSSGWGRGLLSAIGINKNGVSSPKFLCRALAGYILAQLPDMKGDPQVVRHEPNAPRKVGQPGGNTQCVKLLMGLDFGQSQGKIKDCAEWALKQIQDPNNSLHNAGGFLASLMKHFYVKTYLRDIC